MGRVNTGVGMAGDMVVDAGDGVEEGFDAAVVVVVDGPATAVGVGLVSAVAFDGSAEGVLNSTGRTRGVAWTLVISLARSQ